MPALSGTRELDPRVSDTNSEGERNVKTMRKMLSEYKKVDEGSPPPPSAYASPPYR